MNGADNELWDQLQTSCANGPISYRDYIDLALYADGYGYYTKDRERVGRSPDRDFYTAESLGKVFARLVTTAAHDLLGEAGERIATLSGAVAIATGHMRNYALCRRVDCDD